MYKILNRRHLNLSTKESAQQPPTPCFQKTAIVLYTSITGCVSLRLQVHRYPQFPAISTTILSIENPTAAHKYITI